MSKDSIEFTGSNLCEVIEFIDKKKNFIDEAIPFKKLFIDGCDVFSFWLNMSDKSPLSIEWEELKNKPCGIFRMEKGDILSLKIEMTGVDDKDYRDYDRITFTGDNILEIVQFIETFKKKKLTGNYQMYTDSHKILEIDIMDAWWDCNKVMLNLDNLKDGKGQVSGKTAYHIRKGQIMDIKGSDKED